MKLARYAAIAIALLAILDPVIERDRHDRAVIAVVGDRDSTIARMLGASFDVVGTPFAGVRATIVTAGAAPALSLPPAGGPVFVVNDAGPYLGSASVPAVITAGSRASIRVATSADADSVDVALMAHGLIVDRVTAGPHANAALTLVPSAPGPVHVRVAVSRRTAMAPSTLYDALADVVQERWRVLVHDTRPSWMSTFVRRALERDTRFAVSSRVITSRDISTEAGAPARLSAAEALFAYDAIVIGAPDALREPDVDALESFMRERGGAVLFLLDTRTPGPYERLIGQHAWETASDTGAFVADAALPDSFTLRSADIAWPASLAESELAVARVRAARGARGERPVIWESPVGIGTAIVSGVLDAWHYRDSSASSFEKFWPALLARAASAAVPPVRVTVTPPILRAGTRARVQVTVRNALLDGAASLPVAFIDSAGVRRSIRLWPGATPGEFEAEFASPHAPDTYRIHASAGGNDATAAFITTAIDPLMFPSGDGSADAMVAAHGGAFVNRNDLAQLPSLIHAAIGSVAYARPAHPMRSAWWILPFALLLSAEWWWRRRNGFR